ncbi:MAG TPA: TonB-dependent receptor plug domain-containing protein [bacterium]|nr:TonB-dependent receptor plug domain-containing protein [bacterium]HOL48173.1 TonB-dependent receptor plug domain-containing protein [bacterium]HPQ19393.1 TonB-dependent receptor plug domain-containing protein [bacterium]
MFKKMFFIFLISIFLLTFLFADTSVLDFGEIVITATRSEKMLIEAPSSISIIDNKTIEKNINKKLDEIIGKEAGVYNRRTKITDIMPATVIRGIYSTYVSERNLFLIDGLPIIRWQRIPLNENIIDRIEITKGPFSALYGNNAMGGVINIITKQPAEKISGSINMGYETYNTKLLKFGVSGLLNNLGWSISGQKFKTDGYVTNYVTKTATTNGSTATVTGAIKTLDKNGGTVFLIGDKGKNYYEDEAINVKLNYSIKQKHYLDGTYTYINNKYGYEGGPSYLSDTAGNMVKTGNVFINDSGTIKRMTLYWYDFESDYGEAPVNMFNLSYKFIGNNYSVKFAFGNGKEDYWYAYPSSTSYKMTNKEEKNYYQSEIKYWKIENHLVTTGIDIVESELNSKKEKLTNWKDKNSVVYDTNVAEYYGGKSNVLGIFINDEYEVNKKLTLYNGIRYSIWKTKDGYEKYTKYIETRYPERDENSINPKISGVYKINNKIIMRAS